MTDLQVAGVRKRRGTTEALRGLDLAVSGGTILALLGPSGCGKTTLLRLLAGFERCDVGTIMLDGTVVDGPDSHVPPERRDIGYVPQEGLLFPHLTAAGNIGFGLTRAERREGRINEALRLVGLDTITGIARRHPHQLSGGQQQRVALARALAPRPRLVLLDEPFNGLDGSLRRSVAAETAAVLRRAGATAVLVTHDPQEAFAVADRIAVMQDGRVVQATAPQQLYQQPATLAVARLTGPTLELHGEIREGVATTPLGPVPLAKVQTRAPDGRATILLRPEQVRLTAPGAGRLAQVLSRAFRGNHTQVAAVVDGVTLDLQFAGSAAAEAQIWLAVDGCGVAFPG